MSIPDCRQLWPQVAERLVDLHGREHRYFATGLQVPDKVQAIAFAGRPRVP